MHRLLVGALMGVLAGCGGGDGDSDTPGDNVPPVAVLEAPLRARVGEPVLLEATGSSDEDGFIAEYWFEAGDGTPLRQAVSPQLYQTFAAPGLYSVTLHVIDDAGSKDTDRAEIEIR